MARSWCLSDREHLFNKDTPPNPMLQPMQQLLFTSGTAASRCKKMGEMKLASATLWHFFSPWFESAPSIRWVDRRDVQESFLPLLLVTTSQKRTQQEQIFSTLTHLAGSNGMYRRNLNVSYGISPFLLAQRLWSFFWCFKQQKKTTTKTLGSVHCNQVSHSKKMSVFLFNFSSFLSVHGAAQPVAAAAAAAAATDSSTAGPRGSKGTALKVTKRFFRARIQTSCLGGTISAEHLYLTHVPLFVLVPAEGTVPPRPPPSRRLGRGYFGGLCPFFDTTTSFQHEAK